MQPLAAEEEEQPFIRNKIAVVSRYKFQPNDDKAKPSGNEMPLDPHDLKCPAANGKRKSAGGEPQVLMSLAVDERTNGQNETKMLNAVER